MNYQGKQALVLGLGESGLAMALWLARCGAAVRVADTRSAPERLQALREQAPDALFTGGDFSESLLDGVDFIAVSPGLAPARELAPLTSPAAARGIPFLGEIELFAQALAALREECGYAPKVLAVTGTNGKTTVTRLTGMLAERAGLSVQVAGNISPAALDMLRQRLAANDLPQLWVLELSSFQLHTTVSLCPDAATVLNVTQDHLDWHGDMVSYAADKAKIFGAGTVRILNRDDPLVMAMSTTASGAPLLSFGSNQATTPGSFGLMQENGMLWLTEAVPAEDGERKRRKKDDSASPVSLKRLMPADALQIRGRHNALNALAALALCRAIGLPLAPLLHGLRDYRGEPHRVELVATVGGVDYYDDSKGTNVGATVAALDGIGAGRNVPQLILIAGGDGKGQDFSPLAAPVARHARAVLLIGRDAATLGVALAATGVALTDCDTLEQAVRQAAALAVSGDAVLLSPACASLDMFRNYAHRAEVFVDAVRELALARGEVMA